MEIDLNRPMTIGRWTVTEYELVAASYTGLQASPARTIAGPAPFYFDGDIAGIEQRRARFFPPQYEIPDIRLDLITGAILTGGSFAFTDAGHAVAANNRFHDARWMVHQPWSELNLVESGPNAFECERLSKVENVECAYNLTSPGWGNYHHMLIDLLPRLWALTRNDTRDFIRANGVDPDAIPIIVNSPEPFLLDHIAALGLGISPDRIIGLPKNGSVRAEKLFVPHFLAHFVGWAAPELISFYADSVRRIAAPSKDALLGGKLFHLRRDIANDSRAIRDVDAIANMLVERGFRELSPNVNKPQEGWFEFAHASHVVGSMGSNLSNTVFCPPGAKVLCIQSDASNFVLNSSIGAVADQRVGYVFGQSFPETGQGEHVKFEVDLGKVRDAIDSLLS